MRGLIKWISVTPQICISEIIRDNEYNVWSIHALRKCHHKKAEPHEYEKTGPAGKDFQIHIG